MQREIFENWYNYGSLVKKKPNIYVNTAIPVLSNSSNIPQQIETIINDADGSFVKQESNALKRLQEGSKSNYKKSWQR